MLKEIIISTFIVVSVIGVNSFSQKYTDKVIEEKTEDLYALREIVKEKLENDSNSEEDIMKNSTDILEEWKKEYLTLAIYLEHDELEKVAVELISVRAYADTKEYEEMIEKIDMGIFALEHLKDKEVLNVDNFF